MARASLRPQVSAPRENIPLTEFAKWAARTAPADTWTPLGIVFSIATPRRPTACVPPAIRSTLREIAFRPEPAATRTRCICHRATRRTALHRPRPQLAAQDFLSTPRVHAARTERP